VQKSAAVHDTTTDYGNSKNIITLDNGISCVMEGTAKAIPIIHETEEQTIDGATEVQKDTQYVAEKIVAHKRTKERVAGGYLLRTRWVGWTEESDTWEPLANMCIHWKGLVIAYTDNNKEIAASARKYLPKGTQ